MADIFTDWRAWSIILVLTLLTMISATAKYRIGKSGMPVVKERFPQVDDEKWDKVGGYFDRFGSVVVLLSLVPILAWVIPPAAGAYGVRFGPFLFFAFLAKLIRYWILFLIAYGGIQVITN